MVCRGWWWAIGIRVYERGIKGIKRRRGFVHSSRELMVCLTWHSEHILQMPPNIQRLHRLCLDHCSFLSKALSSNSSHLPIPILFISYVITCLCLFTMFSLSDQIIVISIFNHNTMSSPNICSMFPWYCSRAKGV